MLIFILILNNSRPRDFFFIFPLFSYTWQSVLSSFRFIFRSACEKTIELVLTTDFSFMSTDEGCYRWEMLPASFEGSGSRCKGKSRVLTLLRSLNNDPFSDISLYDCPKKGILPEMVSSILSSLLIWSAGSIVAVASQRNNSSVHLRGKQKSHQSHFYIFK